MPGRVHTESAFRCAQTKRAVDKPVEGELGCVTPYIICPGGNWTDADIEFQAGQVQMPSHDRSHVLSQHTA